ncbi:MAG TPA: tetratricopeptide repeat protein, partial [Candidatus Cloacimonadota bacterium]|nr:tetratricopeptide repeat protein [Candidatus Cloacimonadota bacterium]
RLESLLNQAQTEHGSRAICVSVKGEAGLGKTRLIYEFESAHTTDINVLHGACSAVIPSPLNLFSSMFENLFRISINEPIQTKQAKFETAYANLLESAPQNVSDTLKDIIPLIGYLLEIRYQDDRLKQTGPDLLSHLSRSIESFLVEYIKLKSDPTHTMVLILDDLHWIDEASSKVLENLLNTISRDDRLNKLLLILMHRPDYQVPSFISLLVEHHEISLLPLSRQHIEDLIREFIGELTLSQENLETVIRLSEGNPFFLEEWCNYIDELPKDQLKDFPVPVNLHTLILTRLDKLSVPLRMLLYKAAVIGNEFFVEILRKVENRLRDPLDIDATLSELEEQTIILRMLDFEYQSYYFKHITTREVAYQTLLMENRKMLHQLTGEAIEEIFADRIDEFIFTLAEHYSKADNREKALHYLQKAADYASKIYNNKQALQLYEQILAILPFDAEQRRLETRFRIAEIQWMTGNWKDSISEVESILQTCVSSSCRELAFEAHRFLGIAAFYKGDIDTAFQELSSSHQIAVELNDKRLLCIASGNLGNWYFQTKDYAKAKDLQRTGLDLAAELSDAQRQAKALSNLGLIHLEEGEFIEAEKAMTESLNIAQIHRLMKEESIALGNLGYIFIKQSRNDEAIPYLKTKLELAEAMNDKLELIKALGNLGNIAKHNEDYPEAIKCFQRILELRIYLGDEKGQNLVRDELHSLSELLSKSEDSPPD